MIGPFSCFQEKVTFAFHPKVKMWMKLVGN